MAKTRELTILEAISTTLIETIHPGSTVLIDEVKKWTGPFYAITAITDVTIDVSECTTGILEKGTGATTQAVTTDITLAQGMTIYGNFESIEVSVGSAIVYTKIGITPTVEA
jgi:hypothetical protein|tara:strand:+ start:128 stop:463 length:336 start_codon:yes stop_codon:yes gene_type:complete